MLLSQWPVREEGSRKQFKKPKPLIKVFNKTLIEIAIETLNLKTQFYFVARKYKNKISTTNLKTFFSNIQI